MQAQSNGVAQRVAIVLPGGGARGAYEAGALSVMLPALEARGERPAIVCGTSVGAINAALLASLADREAVEQVDALLASWRQMRKSDVIARIVGPGTAMTMARALGELLQLPGVRLPGLMDASPLRRSLERWIDWPAVHRNVRARALDAVCVVATALASGEPVAFVESAGPVPQLRRGDELRYVPVALNGEHVRASAAIPLLFPPIEVAEPQEARGHYIDGGTRLNSPIKPALALGAERVIVVGFEPFGLSAQHIFRPRTPRLADVVANVLDGLLVDQVGADLHRLAAINSFFVDGHAAGPSRSARAYRVSRGHTPYRKVAYALVSPEEIGELGQIAERVYTSRYGGLRGVRHPDYPLISRLLGGRGRSRGELLSFLLFDPEFVEELITAGRRDAERWLARHPGFWCSDAAHDLDTDTVDTGRVAEQHALDEFRERRRR